ncbi:MAG TPA: penicillin-binding protein 2 [Pseudonocardiaceae bacterium]|nr:penicillin-binding protein 2 [Pseudonocardiaceae bacterium]
MNTPLRRVALAVMGMIVLLLLNATYIQVVNADTYRTDPRNRRVLLDEYSRQRGQIIAGGLPVASEVETGGQLRFLRTYLNGPLYAPVTGYYSLRYGSGGIEKAMDSVLNGSDGRLFVRRLSDLITGREPSGGSVELTINPAVQRVAYDQLTRRGYTGAVVAIKPSTGEILAMVSTPSYDPNRLSAHDGAEQEAAWNADTSPSRGSPLTNRAVASTYPPGSTFKLVVSAAALEDGKATPETPLTAASALQLQDTTTLLHNFADERCGSGETATVTEALVRSCNAAFAQLASIVGENDLRKQAQLFGIGQQDLTIPIPVAPSTLGAIPDVAALEQSGIGQRDVALTPLQNAMIAATIANGGIRMKPQLVRSILAPDLSVLERFAPEEADTAMSRFTADQIRDMMVAAENSYRNDGKINGVSIAAKTGTAEHGTDPKNTPPHGWYVAFAPAQNPQVAIAVLVENGGDRNLEATGGSLAAPIGRAVIAAALQGAR